MKNNKTVLMTDFDGTVTKKDFFYLAIEKILSESDLAPWKDYESGKITHFDALNRIFQKIKTDLNSFHDLIMELPIEKHFADTVEYCKRNDIEIYVVSAGADYYINYFLKKLGLTNGLNIIANPSKYGEESGLNMFRLEEQSPYYSHNYGINKEAVMNFLKTKFNKIIFAGDGVPDYYAAQHADKIFARGSLEEMCNKNHLKYEHLDNYNRILEYLKS